MKKLKLYSNTKLISDKLIELENNQKTYNRLLEGLMLLGEFEEKTEIESYEQDEDKMLVYCSDVNGDILMFYPYSNDKKDYLKIKKVTNEGEKQYDLALAKKFELTPENIELTQTQKEYAFKFGRLITDEKTFYTIFLGSDVAYKIEIEEPSKTIKGQDILDALNSLETAPSLMDFIETINKQKINFKSVKTDAYKEFKNVGSFTIGTKKLEKGTQKN